MSDPDAAAVENTAPDFPNDQIPPTGPIVIEVIPSGNATFHAKMAGGYLLIERSAQPYAMAARRLVELGVDPARIIVMQIGGVAIRSASLAEAVR